jgi:hypothetical protein
MLEEEDVPVDKGKWIINLLPTLSHVLEPLINSDNFEDAKNFLSKLVGEGTDSFPLGVGFQLLKAIYSGKGIRRMDRDKFNYSAHLDEIPPDIPIFHLYGADDPLAPPFNLAFIDRAFYAGDALDFSGFPPYSHGKKAAHRLSREDSPSSIRVPIMGSQVQGFVIEGISHLDFFDGRTAEKIVRPLLKQLIKAIWQT